MNPLRISLALAAVMIALLAAGCDRRKCLRSHTEERTRPAWVQIIPVGEVSIPIYHPESKYTAEVCDEYELEEQKQARP